MKTNNYVIFFWLLLIALIFTPQLYAQNTNNPVSVEPHEEENLSILLKKDPPKQGVLIREADDLNPATTLQNKRTKVNVKIIGFVALVNVQQVFINTQNQNINVVYAFPLPKDSTVHKLEMLAGDKEAKITVAPRFNGEQIENAYSRFTDLENNIKRLVQTKEGTLPTENTSNLFTFVLDDIKPAIEPNNQIYVNFWYTQRLNYEEGGFSFFFPMIENEHYIPGLPLGKTKKGVFFYPNPELKKSDIKPGMRKGNIAIDIELNLGINIKSLYSTTHQIFVEKVVNPNRVDLNLLEAKAIPNRDFVLEYKVAGNTPLATLLTAEDEISGFGYFLFMVAPPPVNNSKKTAPKHLELLIDTSDSMQGESLEQAQKALKMCLASLNPYDTFNIRLFSDEPYKLSPEPLLINKFNITKAKNFVDQLKTKGKTDLLPVLRETLLENLQVSSVKIDGVEVDRFPNILIFSDGGVTNQEEILNTVEGNLGYNKVFTFKVGYSTSEDFMKKLAEVGKGTSEIIPTAQKDINEYIRTFFKNIKNPILAKLELEWKEAKDVKGVDINPTSLPDVFQDIPVFAFGSYPLNKVNPKNIRLKVKTTKGKKYIPINYDLAGFCSKDVVDIYWSCPRLVVLSMLWARSEMDELTDKILKDPKKKYLKENILSLAVWSQLSCLITSVAVVERYKEDDWFYSKLLPAQVPRRWEAAPLLLKAGLFSLNPQIIFDNSRLITIIESNINPNKPKNKPNKPKVKNPKEKFEPVLPTDKEPSDIPILPKIENEADILKEPYNNKTQILAKILEIQAPTGEWEGSSIANTLKNTALSMLVLLEDYQSFNTSNQYKQRLLFATEFLTSNIDGFGRLYAVEGSEQEIEIYSLVILALSEYLDSPASQNDPLISGRKELKTLMIEHLLTLRSDNNIWLNKENGREDLNSSLWAATAINRASSKQEALKKLSKAIEVAPGKVDKLRSALITLLTNSIVKEKDSKELKKYLFTNFLQKPLTNEDGLFAMLLVKEIAPEEAAKFKLHLLKNIPASSLTSALGIRYLMLAAEKTKLDTLSQF